MKIIKKIFLIALSLVIIILLATLVYLNVGQYDATATAQEIIQSESIVHDNYYEFNNNSDNGLIFYPGAKVDPMAYAYLSEIDNANVYILRPAFNIAFFNVNGADEIIDNYDLDNWFVGGHSLGGVVASNYAQSNSLIKGVVLLGSYPVDKLENNSIPYLSLYGTNDGVLGDYSEKKELFDDMSKIVEIKGGNHSQFGDYGFQAKDIKSDVSIEEQHAIITDNIAEFIKKP